MNRRSSELGCRAGALALFVVVLTSSCGSESGESVTEEPTHTTSASAGDTAETKAADGQPTESPSLRRMDAKGMAFFVPKGWADITEPTPGLVLAAADLSGSDEIPDMVIVESLRSPPGIAALGRSAARSLAAQEHIKVTTLDAVDIAGVPAAHAKAIKISPGEQLAVDRFAVAVDGQTWSITYSTARWKPRGERTSTLEAILGSWEWERA